MKVVFVGLIFLLMFIGVALFAFFGSLNFISPVNKSPAPVSLTEVAGKAEVGGNTTAEKHNKIWAMKFINPDISDDDLSALKNMGFTVLSGEWGMDDAGVQETANFLDRIAKYGMEYIVVLSDSAAWGPKLRAEKVRKYVKKLASHPAVYGYDISNEAGENLGYGEDFRLKLNQLRDAARLVRSIDPARPVIIRMHYWDEYDGDFTGANPFEAGIADIVMLNLYSNYSEDAKTPLLPDMLRDSAEILVEKIKNTDPNVSVWISLGAFREPPLFVAQSAEQLRKDIEATLELRNVGGISFFGWGPTEDGWYLPRDGKNLLEEIKTYSPKAKLILDS